MNTCSIRSFRAKTALYVLSVLVCLLFLVSCSETDAETEEGPKTLMEAVQSVQSVETSISFEMRGSFNGSGSTSGTHTVSVRSDGTISSNFGALPNAHHTEYFSSLVVDGATTRESRDIYVVPSGTEYLCYEYQENADEWRRSTLTRSDQLSVRREMGFFDDWTILMNALSEEDTQDLPNGTQLIIYGGYAPASLLQDIFGTNMFGSFMYSVEHLIEDEIPCTLTVNSATMLPDTLTFTFENEWIVSDMSFDVAKVVVYFSRWNQVEVIEAPKRATVTYIDTEEQFYSTYYAWNLFLPYIGGQMNQQGNTTTPGQSFISNWNTFQVRIDGGMAKVPLSFSDLSKMGYVIDEIHSSIIMEPNKYKEGIFVLKGADKFVCTFYNDDSVPQPISSCKIGCIDLSASNVPNNGIQIFLPGEVTLGISKESLLSAYGDADQVNSAFSCDTYTWRGDGDMQSFLAEISPITGQVIRVQIKNIPVTGGLQA